MMYVCLFSHYIHHVCFILSQQDFSFMSAFFLFLIKQSKLTSAYHDGRRSSNHRPTCSVFCGSPPRLLPVFSSTHTHTHTLPVQTQQPQHIPTGRSHRSKMDPFTAKGGQCNLPTEHHSLLVQFVLPTPHLSLRDAFLSEKTLGFRICRLCFAVKDFTAVSSALASFSKPLAAPEQHI